MKYFVPNLTSTSTFSFSGALGGEVLTLEYN